ncbi:DUF2075 domain-containing protein [Candidatus Uhrbacteria bacterium]|nr:DUF2075 domain-containing protein [Candidatus Uhrbacteria bacterium]
MIVYQSNKQNFIDDVRSNTIDQIISSHYFKATGRHVNRSEQESWRNSMTHMRDVLRDEAIPYDSGVSIEYHIPLTAKRIDFILTGQDGARDDCAVLIELKQWSGAELSDKDGIVKVSRFGEVSHPSYQVWTYAALLENYCATVYEEGIRLKPCAYLHNYIADDVITNDWYSAYTEKAPVFLEGDEEKERLQAFIKRFVKYGDSTNVMYRIDNGRIKPSKSLADALARMLKGNPEFYMIDDQKVVYETALALAKKSTATEKNVLVVKGGPGTGKSVVAVNLLVELTDRGMNARYVTKNAAPRTVYHSLLTGTMSQTRFNSMFSGSGSFVDVEKSVFDALIVDEAHRLNTKSGMYQNLGENQVKEIIDASKLAIFFLDEDQRVTWRDIGELDEIRRWSTLKKSKVHVMELTSQFRCNGSDGYLAWLDDVLKIRETANMTLEGIDFDFQVVDSPLELRDKIFEKNKTRNKARLVAGYCWNWVSRRDPKKMDIVIPEFEFGMKWNLASEGNRWILSKTSVHEVGCIHTAQGLEMDYVGVIVGPDFVVRNGKVITNPEERARTDASLRGYRQARRQNPHAADWKADAIIKNTYRTLMTRGMKGCYVYCTDSETAEYFRNRWQQSA